MKRATRSTSKSKASLSRQKLNKHPVKLIPEYILSTKDISCLGQMPLNWLVKIEADLGDEWAIIDGDKIKSMGFGTSFFRHIFMSHETMRKRLKKTGGTDKCGCEGCLKKKQKKVSK